MCTCPILSLNQAATELLKITKYSESETNKRVLHPKIYGLALYWGTQVLHYKGKLGKWSQPSLGEKKNESFQKETNNLQFKCIRDQAVPPHMQIDANDMQMAQSKPGFANILCQAASYGVHPGLVCARSSHLGPRGLGVNVRLYSLQKAFQDPTGRSSLPPF